MVSETCDFKYAKGRRGIGVIIRDINRSGLFFYPFFLLLISSPSLYMYFPLFILFNLCAPINYILIYLLTALESKVL